MIELLAIPAWDGAHRRVEDWSAALAGAGAPTVVVRDEGETYLEAGPLRLRGFCVIEDGRVAAVNFELAAPDPAPAAAAVEAAARALGWEVYPDDEDGGDDEGEGEGD